MRKRIVFRPVGWVYNHVTGNRYSDWGDVISDIVLDDELAPALDGIEGFSHIEVLFHISHVTAKQRALLRLHPRDRQDMPEVGVFAIRTQYRPNPIGVTVARLLERRGNLLRVAGLDAYNGTPVLDIKPYVPETELADEARIPEWMQRLRTRPTTEEIKK
jgi:tRNA-Thr(GGU) m(6)t(6)A37 methyltransferase TsaA